MFRPSKLDFAKELLATFGTMNVHLDSTDPLCVLPKVLRGDKGLVLGMGRPGFDYPVSDLYAGLFGMSGTILFRSTPYWISFPWRAVFCLCSLKQPFKSMAWVEDMPSAVKARMAWRVLDGGRTGSGRRVGRLRRVV